MNILLSLFLIAHAKKNLASVSFGLFNVDEPKIEKREILSTKITDGDRGNAVVDGRGVKYSMDGKNY